MTKKDKKKSGENQDTGNSIETTMADLPDSITETKEDSLKQTVNEDDTIIDVESKLWAFCLGTAHMQSIERIVTTFKREAMQSRIVSCQHAINTKGKKCSLRLFKHLIKNYFGKEV